MAQAVASRFKLSPQGLISPGREAFARIWAQIQRDVSDVWELADDEFDAVLIDPASPEALDLLRARRPDSVVIWGSRGGDTTVTGVIPLRLPFGAIDLQSALDSAKRTLAASRCLTEDLEEPAVGDSLEALAEYLHELLRREDLPEWLNVEVEDMRFAVSPKRAVYYSPVSSRRLGRYRDRYGLHVRVRKADCAWTGTTDDRPRGRLEDLLWDVGCHADSSSFLPWIDDEKTYRITRWPPLAGSERRTQFFRAAALMAKRPLRPTDLAKEARLSRDEAIDFLNGCCMAGCLVLAPGPVVRPRKATSQILEAVPIKRSLFRQIRLRLGLTV